MFEGYFLNFVKKKPFHLYSLRERARQHRNLSQLLSKVEGTWHSHVGEHVSSLLLNSPGLCGMENSRESNPRTNTESLAKVEMKRIGALDFKSCSLL